MGGRQQSFHFLNDIERQKGFQFHQKKKNPAWIDQKAKQRMLQFPALHLQTVTFGLSFVARGTDIVNDRGGGGV